MLRKLGLRQKNGFLIKKAWSSLNWILNINKKYSCFSNRIKLMIAPFANFYGKIWVGFCLNTGKHFAISEPWERVWILLRKIPGVFKIAFGLRNWHVFMWQPLEILNITTLCVKLIFCKTKTLFKKLEYRFLVQITKIESQCSDK